MKFLELNLTGLHTPVAKVIRWNNKLYFNYIFGLKRPGFAQYTLAFDAKEFKPKDEEDKLELNGSDYIILPIKRNNVSVSDRHGNVVYCAYRDRIKAHMRDIVLFWEIPNYNYTNIEYTISGDAWKMAEASSGVVRPSGITKIFMPVINIYGNTVLTWTALNSENKVVTQEVKYDITTDDWDVGNIITEE